jgi:hypothetical protein
MEVNWGIFFILIILLRALFPGISMFSYLALVISLHQFTLLITFIGYIIPVRYLFGTFMCLQFLIGPTLAYNGLDQYQYHVYRMQIPEADYFAYAIPAILSFILGLHINAGNYRGEIVNEEGVIRFVKRNPRIPYLFIAIGFVASMVAGFFASEVAFVFYVLGSFKFIGLFMLVFAEKKMKTGPLILVIGSIVASSLGDGMFHDLLTWILFVGSVYAVKYKFGNNLKFISCAGFILLAVTIQQLKSGYRAAEASSVDSQNFAETMETFADTYNSETQNGHSIYSFASLAPGLVRINQGFIITNVMKTVPNKVPYSNGEEMGQVLEAAILPRIIAPNKLQAGDRLLFEKYTGMHLRIGTSMGLGSLGDAYVNFGASGGCVFMFLLGLCYSLVLNYFNKRSATQPVLILFLPLIFYYPIRPDCELQTILGHLVKSTFIILCIVYFWKEVFIEEDPRKIAAMKEAASSADGILT